MRVLFAAENVKSAILHHLTNILLFFARHARRKVFFVGRS